MLRWVKIFDINNGKNEIFKTNLMNQNKDYQASPNKLITKKMFILEFCYVHCHISGFNLQ